MGKLGHHTNNTISSSSSVHGSSRRRLMKGLCGAAASSSGGARKPRGSSGKLSPPPPPPPQSLVLDEDSGFGGDQSLDSEPSSSSALSPPSLLSSRQQPGSQPSPTTLSLSSVSQPSPVSLSSESSLSSLSLSASLSSAAALSSLGSSGSLATLSSVLPSLAMVPQAKLLLVSLLQGGGSAGSSPQPPSPPTVGAVTPQILGHGTCQTGSPRAALPSAGTGQEGQGCLGISTGQLTPASPTSPSARPTHPVAHPKVVEKPWPALKAKAVPGLVELGGEEAQELPTSSSSSVPPLVSFRDVSLLSSLHTFKGSNSGNSPLLCVEGAGAKVCGRGGKGGSRPGVPPSPPSLSCQMSARSSDGQVELRLVSQPEEQHRARYQTEGSRGAVKDRSGAGHPTVKLTGYNKRTTLQVFVGCDSGRFGPHMFYQVCRVTGKNSTPCRERRVEGTAVIETVLDADSDMTMSCDCVGILKERNVDVEHRFKAAVSRGRKKSTKCRLVFRTFVTLPSGAIETLQVVSQPIACTQPPGVPEICRKSLSRCSVEGGDDLFILGKNFLKDAVVIFQLRGAKAQPIWEEKLLPDKDTLQPIHLVVRVPGYCDQSITEEVTVDVMVSSGGRTSESHPLTYLPLPPPALLPSPPTKRELPHLNETWEDKPLPKGVSPCALQLNRHYTETGMLPSPLPDFILATNPSTALVTTTQVSGAAAVPPAAVRTSRVLLSPTKKMGSRSSRPSPRSTRATPIPTTIPTPTPTPTLITNTNPNSSPSPNSNPNSSQTVSGEGCEMEVKHEEVEEGLQGLQGGVSLEVLVEMLKVVQKFPAGSTIHTSVLQLVERLIHSMRNQLHHQCKTELSSQDPSQPSYSATAQERVLPTFTPTHTPTLAMAAISSPSKTQKLVNQDVTTQPQMPLLPPGPATTLALPMATPVSLLPLTVLSALPTTVCAGPKIARVAPVAPMVPVAPTTVVSSLGLARTVRVCVAEEPPLKKAREEAVAVTGGYQIVATGQHPSVYTAPITTTFTSTNTLLPHKLATSTQDTLAVTPPTLVSTTTRQQDLPPAQQVLTTPLLPSHHLAPAPLTPAQHTVYQPVLHTLATAPTTTPQNSNTHTQSQAHLETPNLEMEHTHTTDHTPQQPSSQSTMAQQLPSQTMAVQQTPQQNMCDQANSQSTLAVQHNSQQTLSVSSSNQSSSQQGLSVPTQVSDPLLSQAPLCPMLPPAPPTSQESLPVPVSSSALTRSDPLLSQSSPVTTLRIEAGAAPPPGRGEGAGLRARGGVDPLLAPASTTTQVSMQSEVTSAINLSETELLNYFDPNCFDNV